MFTTHLIETQELSQQLNDNADILLVQVTSIEKFIDMHIPGAQCVTPSELMKTEPPAQGKLPSIQDLETLFSRLGLTPETSVVVYDDEGGGWAGRFIWTLDMIGHQHYAYLNGGLHAWIADKLPLTQDTSKPRPTTEYKIKSLNKRYRITAEDIHRRIGDAKHIVWDARSPEEYNGQRAFAQRAGHIPGAVNLEWTQLMDHDNHLRLRSLELIEQELKELGISADKDVSTHCQSHHRSGLTYLVARLLGFPNIRAYDGSWSEWGNLSHLPVEI